MLEVMRGGTFRVLLVWGRVRIVKTIIPVTREHPLTPQPAVTPTFSVNREYGDTPNSLLGNTDAIGPYLA